MHLRIRNLLTSWLNGRRGHCQNEKDKIIVVGGGLAGLMATVQAAEAGADIDLFSIVPVRRSHSVCAQGASTER